MILLNVDRVTKRFGPDPVLDGVAFDVRIGDRVGLVGPNGAGKSTLLRIIAGQLDLDAGTSQLRESARLGYLEQQPDFAPSKTVWEIALEALAHLTNLTHRAEQVAAAIASAAGEEEQTRLARQYDQLQHQLHKEEAYHLDHRMERVLEGLGFAKSQFQQPVQELSGGQQNRLLLARLLLTQPDIMLLDEPSNHLDIEATEWLEDFLAASSQAFIVVSHDRYFLDRVTTRTLELFHGTVDDYKGNFSAYWRQKDERLEVQRRTFEKQQEEIAKLKDFVRRHHHGQKHAQAKDRERKLERIVPVPPPRDIVSPKMGFPPASRTGDVALRAEGISKSFEGLDKPLFQDLTFEMRRGERWGIIGGNGTGKTTLLRCIVGEIHVDAGQVVLGTGVNIGYYDQQLRCVDPRLMAAEAIRPAGKEFVEQQRRDLLAKFGVTGDMAFQKVASLSGGERSRTALAKLAAEDPNFMVFDEPTNHLDLWACDALEKALLKFDGTVLLVSHDRFFLNRVVDHLLVVEKDRFRVIEGNYDTYLHFVKRGLAGDPPDTSQLPISKTKVKTPENEKPAKRRRKFPYRKVADIEADILEHETQVGVWHQQLVDPDVLRDGEKVKEIQSDLEETQAALDLLYEHWEEATELN